MERKEGREGRREREGKREGEEGGREIRYEKKGNVRRASHRCFWEEMRFGFPVSGERELIRQHTHTHTHL